MNAFVLHDRYFDPESGRISSYFSRLFILIGEESVQYAILDTEKNSFIALADYRLAGDADVKPEHFHEQLGHLFAEEENLLKKYPAVVVGIQTPLHTIVPASLFDERQITKYLELNYRIEEEYQPASDRIPEIEAFNVYGYSQGLRDRILLHFNGAAVINRSTAFIKAISQDPGIHSDPSTLFLHIRKHDIELACFGNGKLLFINSFTYQTKEDVLYYTLFALGQLKFRPETFTVTMSGLIDEGSEMQRMLEPYFQNINMSVPPGSFQYSPLLAQAPLHRYTDLFALALCGS